MSPSLFGSALTALALKVATEDLSRQVDPMSAGASQKQENWIQVERKKVPPSLVMAGLIDTMASRPTNQVNCWLSIH